MFNYYPLNFITIKLIKPDLIFIGTKKLETMYFLMLVYKNHYNHETCKNSRNIIIFIE